MSGATPGGMLNGILGGFSGASGAAPRGFFRCWWSRWTTIDEVE